MLKTFLAPVLLALSSVAVAQSLPSASVATVNGEAISSAMYEQNLRANFAQGLKDTPQLRQAVKEELINRELLTQYAEKLGIDNKPEVKMQLKQIRENLLVEVLMSEVMRQNPITEEEIRADYNRQVSQISQGGAPQQYKISVIVVPSEAEAQDIVSRLNRGISFAALAKERSVDGSKGNGGLVGWMLPNQINPTLAEVVIKLNKGAFAGPIATGDGWNIIKVDEKRAFKSPTLEESKNGIVQLLIQQRRIQLINQLRSESKVVQ